MSVYVIVSPDSIVSVSGGTEERDTEMSLGNTVNCIGIEWTLPKEAEIPTVSVPVVSNIPCANPAWVAPDWIVTLVGSVEFHSTWFVISSVEPSLYVPVAVNSAGVFDGGVAPVKLVYGKVLRLNHDLFIEDALVFKKLFSEEVKLTNTANNYFVKVNFKGFPYLGIWTKPVKAPFLCIEPWYGLADSTQKTDFSNKKGILHLAPSKQFDASYTITIG